MPDWYTATPNVPPPDTESEAALIRAEFQLIADALAKLAPLGPQYAGQLVIINPAGTGYVSVAQVPADAIQGLDAGAFTSGVLPVASIPDLPASQIIAGVFALDRIPDLPTTKFTDTVDVEVIPSLPATKIGSGDLTRPWKGSGTNKLTKFSVQAAAPTTTIAGELVLEYENGSEQPSLYQPLTSGLADGIEAGGGDLTTAFGLTTLTVALNGGTESGGGQLNILLLMSSALSGGTETGGGDLTAAFYLTAITAPLSGGTETGGGDALVATVMTVGLSNGTETGGGDLTVDYVPVPLAASLSGGTEAGGGQLNILLLMSSALSGGTEAGGGDLTAAFDLTVIEVPLFGGTESGTGDLTIPLQMTGGLSGGTETGGGDLTAGTITATAITVSLSGGTETGGGDLTVDYVPVPLAASLSGGTEAGGGQLNILLLMSSALSGGTEAGGGDLTAAPPQPTGLQATQFSLRTDTTIVVYFATFQYDDNSSFSSPTSLYDTIESGVHTKTWTPPVGTTYVRVRYTTAANDGGLQGPWSETVIFTNAIPLTASLSGGIETGGGDLTISLGTQTDPYVLTDPLNVTNLDIFDLLRGTGGRDGDDANLPTAGTYFKFTVPSGYGGYWGIAIDGTPDDSDVDWDLRAATSIAGLITTGGFKSSTDFHADESLTSSNLDAGDVYYFIIYPHLTSDRAGLTGMTLTLTPNASAPPPQGQDGLGGQSNSKTS